MKKINLTVFERIQLSEFVGGLKGDIKALRIAFKVLDKLDLTQDEKKEVNLQSDGNQITWSQDDREFELEFEDTEFELLLRCLSYNEWPARYVRRILPMLEKLEQVRDAK